MLTACTEYTMVPSDHRKIRSWCLFVVNTTYEWCRNMPTTHTDHKICPLHIQITKYAHYTYRSQNMPTTHTDHKICSLHIQITKYAHYTYRSQNMPTIHTDHKIILWHHSKVTGDLDQLINIQKLIFGFSLCIITVNHFY